MENAVYFINRRPRTVHERIFAESSLTLTIQVRVDEPTKAEAMNVFNMLGMSLSDGVCLLLRQVAMHRGLPFEVKIPNALTTQTREKSEKGTDLHRVSSVDELFEELDA